MPTSFFPCTAVNTPCFSSSLLPTHQPELPYDNTGRAMLFLCGNPCEGSLFHSGQKLMFFHGSLAQASPCPAFAFWAHFLFAPRTLLCPGTLALSLSDQHDGWDQDSVSCTVLSGSNTLPRCHGFLLTSFMPLLLSGPLCVLLVFLTLLN